MNDSSTLSTQPSGRRRLPFRRLGGVGFAVGATALAVGLNAWVTESPITESMSPATVFAAAPALTKTGPVPESFADLVEKVAPAVVTIRATRTVQRTEMQEIPDIFRRFFGEEFDIPRGPRSERGLGSGVVVSADGYILTNNHVVEGANRVRVDFTDGRSFDSEVVGTDPPSDLAVLKVDAQGLPTLQLADSDQARVGDVVLAIGNPLGIGQTVTMGIVSAKGRSTGASEGAYEDFIQTDAPINRGNSGGALVNLRGELIGINSQIMSPSGFNIGIGFAIPSTMARDVMDQLVKHGRVRRGLLGVIVQQVTPELARSLNLDSARGAIITRVNPDSPAERAGLQRGDVILSFDGKKVDSSNSLRNAVARVAPGTTVRMTLLRDGRERDVEVKVGELTDDQIARQSRETPGREGGRYGLTVEPLTPELRRRLQVEAKTGVAVADVAPGSPAAEAGIQPGDIIEQVDGKPVKDADELRAALDAASKDRPALVLVHRRGNTVFVPLARKDS
ncbi:MAG TPA: DegQ family serine endoprotease [Vicinamibacterales bacterium]